MQRMGLSENELCLKNSAIVRNSNRKIMMLNAVEWIPHVRTKPEIVQKNVMFSNERGNLTKE